MTRRARVHRLPMASPDDMSALSKAIAEGRIRPENIMAVLGKTEGNGNVNDWTRALAARCLKDLIAWHAGDQLAATVCVVMSGGTEGALSPHMTVFEAREEGSPAEPGALAIGRAHTAALPPEELGRMRQVADVAEGVARALVNAGLDAADVHFVQVKCPLLTSGRIAEAASRGAGCVTTDTLKSMALSRAAAALGVAVALGEIDRDAFADEAIGHDLSLFSTKASVSAGVELLGHEVVVLGAGGNWCGPLRIDSAVMTDALDVAPVRAALARLGLAADGQLAPDQAGRLTAVLAKAEAGSTGSLRGRRHTMLVDSDVSSTRHARAFLAGVLAGLVGHAELYVSGGAEHQGPDGGGPVAIIAEAA